jgi:hypothetical protein
MRGTSIGGAVAAALVLLVLPAGATAGIHARVTAHAVGDGTTFPAQIAAGDFDADATVDLVAAGINTGGADWSVLFGDGGGAFAPALTAPAPPRPEGVAVADFDEDGASDFVLPADEAPTGVSVVLSNADGTFDVPQPIALPNQANAVATGDYDGDGHADIAVSVLQSVFVVTGVGNGTFNAPQGPFATGSPGGIGRIATGDFDGDRIDDVVVTPSTPTSAPASGPTVGTMLGVGDGTLAPPVATPVPSVPVDPRVADFNEDGRADVLVTYPFFDAGSVLLASADGSLAAPIELATPNSPTTAAVGDADHDGHADALVAGASPDAVSVFRGTGTGAFGPGIVLPTQVPVSSALAADVNGDGFADLELGSFGAPGTLFVAINAPFALPAPATLAFPSAGVGTSSAARAVSISNDGLPALHIGGIALAGANAGEFRVLADGCTGRTLPAGASCAVALAMVPAAGGARTGALVVSSDSAEGPLTVPLGGSGIAAAATAPQPAKLVDRTAPALGIAFRAQRLRTVLRHGLRTTIGCSEACTTDIRLTLARTTARRLHLTSRLAVHRSVRFATAGRRAVTLRLTRRAVRTLRRVVRVTFALRVAARDAAGNRRLASRTVRLLR